MATLQQRPQAVAADEAGGAGQERAGGEWRSVQEDGATVEIGSRSSFSSTPLGSRCYVDSLANSESDSPLVSSAAATDTPCGALVPGLAKGPYDPDGDGTEWSTPNI